MSGVSPWRRGPSTNKRALDELVGPTEAIEIWGKPFDIEDVVGSVRRALEGT